MQLISIITYPHISQQYILDSDCIDETQKSFLASVSINTSDDPLIQN